MNEKVLILARREPWGIISPKNWQRTVARWTRFRWIA